MTAGRPSLTQMPSDAISNEWRIFIALRVPGEVRDHIEKTQADLRDTLARSVVRWTHREQFHLTLKFLGGVEVARLAELEAALRSTVGGLTAFPLSAEGIGVFPDLRRARVIWAGVTSPHNELAEVFRAVQKGAREFSKEPIEEQFVGHVTLGRVKILKRDEARELGMLTSIITRRHFGKWIVQNVEIMRSELSAAGAVHTLHAAIPLMPLGV